MKIPISLLDDNFFRIPNSHIFPENNKITNVIFLHLPKNCWAKIFGRRRTIRFYALNYILLRNLVLKIKSFYPIGLYKVRGFYIENEVFKIVEGKSRLGSGFGYYG